MLSVLEFEMTPKPTIKREKAMSQQTHRIVLLSIGMAASSFANSAAAQLMTLAERAKTAVPLLESMMPKAMPPNRIANLKTESVGNAMPSRKAAAPVAPMTATHNRCDPKFSFSRRIEKIPKIFSRRL